VHSKEKDTPAGSQKKPVQADERSAEKANGAERKTESTLRGRTKKDTALLYRKRPKIRLEGNDNSRNQRRRRVSAEGNHCAPGQGDENDAEGGNHPLKGKSENKGPARRKNNAY